MYLDLDILCTFYFPYIYKLYMKSCIVSLSEIIRASNNAHKNFQYPLSRYQYLTYRIINGTSRNRFLSNHFYTNANVCEYFQRDMNFLFLLNSAIHIYIISNIERYNDFYNRTAQQLLSNASDFDTEFSAEKWSGA